MMEENKISNETELKNIFILLEEAYSILKK